jgi:peroxiredoxin
MVQVNQKAPKFSTVDTFGNGIDLLALEKKHRYVLIVFLRYSGCAFCNLAIHRLTMEYKQITKADCKIVAFVQSDKEKIIENIYDTHNPKPQFPIIPDKEMKFYKKYNVEPSVTQTLKMITNIPMWIESISKHSHVKLLKPNVGQIFTDMIHLSISTTHSRLANRAELGPKFSPAATFVTF